MRGTVLSNADNLRKLYMVNMNPEAWDENELLYRSPQHWQAVTVSTHVGKHDVIVVLCSCNTCKMKEYMHEYSAVCGCDCQLE